MYHVISLDGPSLEGEDHGDWSTLDRAMGAVDYDRLTYYEIWRDGDVLVAHNWPLDETE